jgi:putative colanic acid biosynthesis acetyltransferase WcaF
VLWTLVRLTLYRWSLPRAFRWRCFWLRRFGAKLGNPVYIRPTAHVFHPWLLTIGDWSSVADAVTLYNLGPITIGSHTTISQGAYLCAGSHDYTKQDLPLLRPPIKVGDGVWIAAEAFIGPGVTVGDDCVVAARAVVTKDVEPGKVVGGNPARMIKDRVMTAGTP